MRLAPAVAASTVTITASEAPVEMTGTPETSWCTIGLLPVIAGRRWRTLAGRARGALDRFAPAAVAALTAVLGSGPIVRGAHGLVG
jgi:hypothetical protein